MLQSWNVKNKDLIVNINGKLVHREQAAVNPFDSAVQGGDAVWEGLRLYDGCIFALNEHLARLRGSAKALAFTHIPTDDEIITELRKTLHANQMTDGVHIRLTLSRGIKVTSGMDPRLNQSGPTLIILAEHKPPVYNKNGLQLVTSSIRRFPPDCLDPKIHHANLLQSILAKIEANHAGADDALMLDYQGFVAETNATHLFMVYNNTVYTPHTHACPEGITRSTVLSLCRQMNIPTQIKNLSLTEFYRADEVFCTGTMGELAGISNIDGRTIGQNEFALTQRLSNAYGEHTANHGIKII